MTVKDWGEAHLAGKDPVTKPMVPPAPPSTNGIGGPEMDPDLAEHYGMRDVRVPPKRWEWLLSSTLFLPKPPPQWAVRDLGFAPGRPNLISGPSSAAKTLLVQSLAISLAGQQKLWGHFPPLDRPLTVAHLDVDLGVIDLEFRYRRILAGWPVPLSPEDLSDRLRFISFPDPMIDLMRPNARDLLKRELEGVDICIGDALRGLASGNENDSEFRRALDVATAVSSDVGVTFIFLHHTGHPVKEINGKSIPPVDDDRAGRGSTAIKDGAGTILRIGAKANDGRRVWMAKPPGRTGVEWEGKYVMQIRAPDVVDPSVENRGLRIELFPERDSTEIAIEEAARQNALHAHDIRETMIAIIKQTGIDGYAGGVDALARAVSDTMKSRGKRGIRTSDGRDLFVQLEAEKIVTAHGSTTKRRLYLTALTPRDS